ncbi:MAG: hypothetical protein V2B14_05825 [bacterium]
MTIIGGYQFKIVEYTPYTTSFEKSKDINNITNGNFNERPIDPVTRKDKQLDVASIIIAAQNKEIEILKKALFLQEKKNPVKSILDIFA